MSKKKSTSTRRAESAASAARAAAIREEQERKERRRRGLVVGVVLVVVAAVATVLVTRLDTSDKPTTAPSGAVGYAVPAGPSSAPVKVVVYEDFLCPFCGRFEAASRGALQKDIDAGKVQVQYHVLNFLTSSSSTDYSLRSANALAVVLDASGPKVAKKFHDLLYEHQPQEGGAGLSDGQLLDYAVRAGASRSKVQDGISNRAFGQWIANVTSQASKDNVTQTPTIKVDGKELPGKSISALVAVTLQAVDAGSSG